MKTARYRKFQVLLGVMLILALALPIMPTNIAMAQSATVTPGAMPGFDAAATLRVKGAQGPDIYLGVEDLGSGTNRVAGDGGNPMPAGVYPVTFSWDQPGNKLIAAIPSRGVSLTYDFSTMPSPRCPSSDWNTMRIVVRDSTTAGGLAWQNVLLDGSSIGSFAPPDGIADVTGSPGYQEWAVSGYDFSQSFTVNADLAVAGTFNANESLKAEFSVGCTPPPPTTAGLSANDTTICVGDPTTINVNFASVTDLYGYEFKMNYPVAGFTATGAFVNDWFDTAGAYIPWNGTPDGGVVKFAASKQAPAGMPVSGSGTVAQLTLTATTAGVYDITLSDVLLGDRDGNRIAADVAPNKVTVEVCGLATVSGKVTLQGRSAPPTGTLPPTSGTVTLADAGFGAFSATFDATGAFTINNVKVAPGGTNYTITAAHGLYLSNQLVQNLTPGATVTLPDTRLKGGDADNSGSIEVNDLGCIGGAFGAAPVTCGVTGGSDINADGLVNILDLVLPGGNYGLASSQPW